MTFQTYIKRRMCSLKQVIVDVLLPLPGSGVVGGSGVVTVDETGGEVVVVLLLWFFSLLDLEELVLLDLTAEGTCLVAALPSIASLAASIKG